MTSRAVVEVVADASKVADAVQRALDKAFAELNLSKAQDAFNRVADIAKKTLTDIGNVASKAGGRVGEAFQAGGEAAEQALRELQLAAAARFATIVDQAQSTAAATAAASLAGGVGDAATTTAAAINAGLAATTAFGRKTTTTLDQTRRAYQSLQAAAQRYLALFSGSSGFGQAHVQTDRLRASVISVGRSFDQIPMAKVLAIGPGFRDAGATSERSLRSLARTALDGFTSIVSRATTAATAVSSRVGGAFAGLASTARVHLENLSSSVRSKMGDLASSVLDGVKTMGLATAVGLGAAAIAATTLGVRIAAANETAAISFEVLLGSAESAQAFMAQLQAFAAATPFDLPTLRSAASGFLTVGVSAERIIPLLTRIGDATAAMGTGAQGVDRATFALKQMALAGKATKEDLNQLSDAGVPILDALSAHLGVTVVELLDMLSDGKVSAEDVFQSIEEGAGSSMARISGMMARQSMTLEGLWSSFKDNAGQALAKFAEPLIPSIKKALDFAAVNVPKVLEFFQDVASRIAGVFKDSPVPEQYFNAIKMVGEKLLPLITDGFNHLVTVVEENKEGLEKFGRFMAEIVIPTVGTLIGNIILLVFWLTEVGVSITAHVAPAFRFMAETFISVVGSILEAAEIAFGWVPGLGDKIRSAGDQFDEFSARVAAALDRIDGKTVDVWVNTHERGIVGEHGGSGSGDGSTAITGMAVGGVTTREGLVNVHPKELVLPLESVRTADLLARAIKDANAGLQASGEGTDFTPNFDVRVFVGDTELDSRIDVRINERNRVLKGRVGARR